VSNPAEPRRRAAKSASQKLRQLAERVLEAPELDDLTRLLTTELKPALDLGSVGLLLWDRKLDSFETLSPAETRGDAGRSETSATPEARWLLSEGQLIDTGRGGRGTLVPLLARSGLIGMLVLGSRGRAGAQPFRPAELRELASLAQRAALALENHLYHREVVASERLAALGTMAGMLAHDFRGPMTVIRGYAEMLQDPALPREDVCERARLITEMVDRLERMTTETLDFARGGGRVARRNVGLSRLLHAFASELQEELPGIQVLREIELPAEAQGSLDVDKLHRVLSNIAANARDAMGGHGRLSLRARLAPAEQGGPRLEIELGDEGPGVSAELRERLFEPFVTQGKKGGTGLGLAVARRFAEDHGGSLTLLPEGPGARFRISLPLEAPGAG
jgi:signal transduction histidine kinase